jgi:hypothetical protein
MPSDEDFYINDYRNTHPKKAADQMMFWLGAPVVYKFHILPAGGSMNDVKLQEPTIT